MTTDPRFGDPVLIYPSRTKTVLLLIGAVGFVAAGVWIWTLGASGRVASWKVFIATFVGIPFFGGCGLYYAYRLVRSRPAVVIDSSGLTDSASAAAAGHLAWSEIACVVPYSFSGQAMLGIVPHDVEALLERQSWFRRRLMKMNMGMGATPVNIPQAILPMTVVELAQVLHSSYGVRIEIPS